MRWAISIEGEGPLDVPRRTAGLLARHLAEAGQTIVVALITPEGAAPENLMAHLELAEVVPLRPRRRFSLARPRPGRVLPFPRRPDGAA